MTVNETPVSKFSLPVQICSGVSFSPENKSYISTGTVHYVWVFGVDSSNLDNPTYTYNAPGTQHVSLRAISGAGCSSISKDSIEVLNTNVSTFTANHIGFGRVTFAPTDATGTTYSWNFGDNTLGSGKNPTHQYVGGTYQVSLTVTNASGCSTTSTSTVVINVTGISQANGNVDTIKVFPNPFAIQTNVVYTLNHEAKVAIEVIDILGNRVAYTESTWQQAGENHFVFNGPKPGTYFIKMIIDGTLFVNRVVQQ